MIKLLITSSVLFITGFSFIGCDNEDDVQIDIASYQVANVIVNDVDDFGDPSDIEVSFDAPINESLISEYRIVYSDVSTNSELSPETFNALSDKSFKRVTTIGGDNIVRLDKEQLSLDGETMVDGKDYQIHILSIGEFGGTEVVALSDPSSNFQLADNAIFDILDFTTNIRSVSDEDNDGNASDIFVSFSTALSNFRVEEYRLLIIKNALADNFDVENAKAVEEGNYYSITNVSNDSTSYSFNPSADLKDVEGNDIIQNEAYTAFILTIGTFKNDDVFALSGPSSLFVLIIQPETSTLVEDLDANDAISVDSDGNIYVSEYGVYNNSSGKGSGTKVMKITPSGDVSEFVSGLNGPVGNAIDSNGNFYVNDDNNFDSNGAVSGTLLKFSPNGDKSIIAEIDGYPAGVLLGTDGNFYVSNYSKPLVHKVTPDGTITDFATDNRLTGGVGIAYDDDGNIIVGNFITGDILSVDPSGNVSLIVNLPIAANNAAIGYITFFEGYIYATGLNSHIIHRVSLAGDVTEFAGNGNSSSLDGELRKASFTRPNGIAVDPNRRVLYVSDAETDGSAALRVIPLD